MTMIIASSAMLLACQQMDSRLQKAKPQPDSVIYQCDEQVRIEKQQLDEQTVRLKISDQLFDLTTFDAPDKSQKYYSSEQGLQPEQGLLWIENEQSATLKSLMLDHTIQIEDYPVIYQCQPSS
ncbi:hypothetical protein SAMN05421749_102393 [Acinetobacter marinus]|uniref:Membrane-bound lysozyme-inhibitor of c-type lysozyme n=1 Tax=Acinetobacter marinus TaxID=281375 RepID=A0A1G6HMP0_9GAMM|nr:hypothetical protein [Acinetobacter marinus]SDB95501.1 hypothetical protein SAMN05421749_102393 [Acinetobacter marinus]